MFHEFILFTIDLVFIVVHFYRRLNHKSIGKHDEIDLRLQ